MPGSSWRSGVIRTMRASTRRRARPAGVSGPHSPADLDPRRRATRPVIAEIAVNVAPRLSDPDGRERSGSKRIPGAPFSLQRQHRRAELRHVRTGSGSTRPPATRPSTAGPPAPPPRTPRPAPTAARARARRTHVTPARRTGSVQENRGRPAALRRASIRARNPVKRTALTGVTPDWSGSSVKAHDTVVTVTVNDWMALTPPGRSPSPGSSSCPPPSQPASPGHLWRLPPPLAGPATTRCSLPGPPPRPPV